jgi:uncharacterized protein YjiS (DUF1127 family)
MIMSISTTADRHRAGGVMATLAAAIRRSCAAYVSWRMEQSAVAVLHSMSDRELGDIGLSRADITKAVRSRAARDRAFACEY